MKKIILSLLVLCSLVPMVCAFDARPPKDEVVGIVRMVGNEPFSELVIDNGAKKLFSIRGDLRDEMSDLQGQQIKARGDITEQAGLYTKAAINVREYEIISQGKLR